MIEGRFVIGTLTIAESFGCSKSIISLTVSEAAGDVRLREERTFENLNPSRNSERFAIEAS